MAKTDKELAVDILCAYLHAGYPPPQKEKNTDENRLRAFLNAAYEAVSNLPDHPET